MTSTKLFVSNFAGKVATLIKRGDLSTKYNLYT